MAAATVAELASGIERLPQGRRRRYFEAWLEKLIAHDFAGRILPFDTPAALLFGKIDAAARAEGFSPAFADVQIAAVAARNGHAVATRDVRRFAPFGVPIIDPFDGRREGRGR